MGRGPRNASQFTNASVASPMFSALEEEEGREVEEKVFVSDTQK